MSFFKFAQLRPKECVLAGSSGTHSVCVCIYHENFSLLMDSINLQKEEDGKMRKMRMREVFAMAMCQDPHPNCYLGQCPNCPGTEPVREMLNTYFEETMQDEVQFQKWVTVDRCSLETLIKSTEEFIDLFIEALPDLMKHHFIAVAQGNFLKKEKENLKPDECIVTGDFSENYSCIIQDAIQGVHWLNDQITVHPFVCYYKHENSIKVLNFIVHDNKAVFTFQHMLIHHLKKKIKGLKIIKYFSDGAASQYKNRKNAFNLRLHLEDFGVKAIWHFFASCHGKGACDGLAGTWKREAARESLLLVRKQPMVNVHQLYEWSKKKFKDTITTILVTKHEIEATASNYQERYDDPPPLEGILSCHCIEPLSPNSLRMLEYSEAPTCAYKYYGNREDTQFEDLNGFVIVSGEEKWQLVFINDKDEQKKLIQVLPLQKNNETYQIPSEENFEIMTADKVICIVNINLNKDGYITLPRKDVSYANLVQKER